MADVIGWVQANWMPVLVTLLAIDQVLVGIFPQVAFFGSIKDILMKLTGKSDQTLLK